MNAPFRLFACVLFFLIPSGIKTQTHWDLNVGGGIGNYLSLRSSAGVVLPSRWTISAFAHLNADVLLLNVLKNSGSYDVVSFGPMVGYALELGPMSRLNLRGGLDINSISNVCASCGSDTRTTVGLVLDPRFELMPMRYLGLGVGSYVNFTSVGTYFGISIDLMAGNLRD
jgi:hypothetical protein